MSDANGTMTLVYRAARADDAAALALVGSATFLDTFAGILPGADIVGHCRRQHAEDVYRQLLSSPDAVIWLAETEQGAPVGYLVLDRPTLPLAGIDERDLEVKRIYLLSRTRGLGAGRRLMALAVDAARARGARRLLLGVYAQNTQALGFYAHLGFVRVGHRRFQVGDGEYDDDILSLELAP